jgi:RNA polymerase sigma-70 factor, ECF subfamily
MTDNLEARSDAELLQLALAGDESAFTLLYDRLKGPIFRYAFYMTNSKTAAEEVIQEVFISLLRDGRRYREAQGDVAAFAFGIARNIIKRLQRRESPYQALPSDEILDKLQANQTETEAMAGQIIHHERLAQVRAAIASLPDHYRQVIVLCDLCELSYAEAASRLRCAVGTVRSRLSRAHALLAQKLEHPKKSRTELLATGTEECLI